jgi:hypothetical protein
MTWPWRRSFTGSRSRTALVLAAALALLIPASARAQSLKLSALKFPPSEVVGPWVSYRVRTQSGSRQIRDYTQRVAIVSKEEVDGRPAFWVELKTTDATGITRIERGLFAEPPPAIDAAPEGDEAGASGGPPSEADAAARPYRMVRYQVLTPGGRLFEYPVAPGSELRAGAPVSTFELFEYDTAFPPIHESLGLDTLRIGRRVVPSIVDRTIHVGSEDWSDPEDTTYSHRTVLIQTYWRNGAVPITGFARSLFQVASVSYAPEVAPDTTGGQDSTVAATPDSTARASQIAEAAAWVPSDSLLRAVAANPRRVISWTDVLLLDLGSDAVPEVTQQPEALTPDQEIPSAPVR